VDSSPSSSSSSSSSSQTDLLHKSEPVPSAQSNDGESLKANRDSKRDAFSSSTGSPDADSEVLSVGSDTDGSRRSSRRLPTRSRFGAPKVKNLPHQKRVELSILTMVLAYLKAYIPPVFIWPQKYQLQWFLKDFVAGLSTGMYGIPQAMALGVLAGLTPVYGLYSLLAPSVVYVLLGPSRSMAVGPASVISLMVGSAVSNSSNPAILATTINFFMGIIFLGLGFLRAGFLSTVISRPIVVGFTAAAAVVVDSSQVKHILGVKAASNSNIIDFFRFIIPAIRTGPVNGWDAVLGLCCLFFMISLRFHPVTRRHVPGPIIVSIFSILITWGFHLNKSAGIAIVGSIPSGLPIPSSPLLPLKEMAGIAPSLIVISAISLVELVSISKTFAVKAGSVVNTNQELVALGAAAFLGSFFRSFPVSASFSRTALNDAAGAKSQLSSVVSIILTVFVLLFASPAIKYLPMTVLAAIIIGATLNLFDFEEAIFIWKTKKRDFFVLVVAFVLTLLLGAEYGVLIAVCLNIIFILLDQYRMRTRELAQLPYKVTDTLFDTLHPDIQADEAAHQGDTEDLSPSRGGGYSSAITSARGNIIRKGGKSQQMSSARFVIKDHFPESFTHPHLFIIRPADTLTYVNVDSWVMHIVADSLEKLLPQWTVEGSEEMDEVRAEMDREESLKLLSKSLGPMQNGDAAGRPNGSRGRSSQLVQGAAAAAAITTTSSSSTTTTATTGGGGGGDDDDDDGDRTSSRMVRIAAPAAAENVASQQGTRSSGNRGRSMSIVQHGSVRPAKPGELAKGDEDKVEKESNRKEIKEYAERTRTLKGFVIIDMVHINCIDSVVVRRLLDIHKTLLLNHIALAVARPRSSVLKYLIQGSFVSTIGQDFVVDSVHHCSIRCNAVLRAAKRFQARQLLEAQRQLELDAQTHANIGVQEGNVENV